MSYNILGVNPFHNGSVCVLSDGEIVEYIEEERLTRQKYDELPFKSILNILQKYKIDAIAIGGLNQCRVHSNYFRREIIGYFLQKLDFTQNQYFYLDNIHHTTHISTSFYNSGFTEAIGVVIDGGGSTLKDNKVENNSIFLCSYPHNFSLIYESPIFLNNLKQNLSIGIGQSFERLCDYFGFKSLDAGKIMGLSSYGNPNSKLPKLFKNDRTDPNIINSSKLYNDFFPKDYTTEWHYNESKITDLEKDLSWKLQTESQTILGDYVEKAIQETKLNNVVVAGGYGLNCVANYYLKKRFPKVNFYFEPISHDGGTAIGAAKLLWHEKTQDVTIQPQKTIYYGPKYSKEELLKGIQKYLV